MRGDDGGDEDDDEVPMISVTAAAAAAVAHRFKSSGFQLWSMLRENDMQFLVGIKVIGTFARGLAFIPLPPPSPL